MEGTRGWRLLLIACVLPAALSLGNQVQDVDPAQYADVARRVLQGHWLALRDLHGPFVNKPPLMMWAQAAAMAVAGVTSFAARLPALLFGVLAVLGTFLVGRELRPPRPGEAHLGLVAAALFGGSVALHHMVADPKVDLALTAMSTLAIWAVLAARRRPALAWLAWGFGALAMLSKGPVGLALPVLAVAPELLRPGGVSTEPSLVKRLLSVKPVRGLLLVAALVCPFYVATALAAGGDSARELLWTQGFGRIFGGSGWHDATTPLYFVHTGLWALLPFTPLLVVALGRRLAAFARARTLPPDVGRVPLWWFALPFCVISSSSFKLPQYVYWLGPPAALLTAEELRGLSEVAHRRWQLGFVALAAAAAGLLAVLVAIAFPSHWPWLAVAAALPALAWLATRRASAALRTTALCVAATLGFLTYFHAGLQPALLEYQPSRQIGALVREKDPAAAVLPCVGVAPAFSLAFYAQRDVADYGLPELKAAVEAGAVHVALVGDGQLAELRAAGLRVESLGRFSTYPTSVPRRAFLVAATRESVLGHVELVSLAAGR